MRLPSQWRPPVALGSAALVVEGGLFAGLAFTTTVAIAAALLIGAGLCNGFANVTQQTFCQRCSPQSCWAGVGSPHGSQMLSARKCDQGWPINGDALWLPSAPGRPSVHSHEDYDGPVGSLWTLSPSQHRCASWRASARPATGPLPTKPRFLFFRALPQVIRSAVACQNAAPPCVCDSAVMTRAS